jgi:hypothetical protein
MNLFEPVPEDQLGPEWRRCAAALEKCGLRVSAVRYKPTGVIDYVIHQTARPRKGVLRHLANLHLLNADTGAAQ